MTNFNLEYKETYLKYKDAKGHTINLEGSQYASEVAESIENINAELTDAKTGDDGV